MDRYKQMQNKEQTETFYGKSAMVKQIDSLKIQLKDAEDVIEAGKPVAGQIFQQAAYRSTTCTDSASKFSELCAKYDKQYRSAARKEPECKTCNDKREVGRDRINCPTCRPFPGHAPYKPENLKSATPDNTQMVDLPEDGHEGEITVDVSPDKSDVCKKCLDRKQILMVDRSPEAARPSGYPKYYYEPCPECGDKDD